MRDRPQPMAGEVMRTSTSMAPSGCGDEKTLTQRMARFRPRHSPERGRLGCALGHRADPGRPRRRRNRGHFTGAMGGSNGNPPISSSRHSQRARRKRGATRMAPGTWHHLVLVTATVAPMAEAMGEARHGPGVWMWPPSESGASPGPEARLVRAPSRAGRSSAMPRARSRIGGGGMGTRMRIHGSCDSVATLWSMRRHH